MEKPSAIVIGAGFTGVATAHDLAQRGFEVTVVERGPIANGTSGRTHGLLHSGGRYAVKDHESAVECIDENMILRKIVPEVIEPNGGLFIALTDSDLAYGESFIEGCEACHIPIEQITPKQTLEMEPAITPDLLAAFTVPDGTFDPLRLAMAFAATAKTNGARFRLYTDVDGFVLDGKGNVTGVKITDRTSGEKVELHADIVINCTGAWAGEVAELAGADVPIKPTPGIMVAYNERLCERALNRLCPPSDGDIILPQRRMMVVGTTSFEVSDLDYIPVVDEQIKQMYDAAVEMIPGIAQAHQRGVYMATRPLVGAGTGRSLARTFKCFDHAETHHIEGLVTVTGGKATTMRLMAEKAVDLVCEKVGLDVACKTAETPLVSYREFYALPN
jgi:glycerol-3-phosphate dehydrogenase